MSIESKHCDVLDRVILAAEPSETVDRLDNALSVQDFQSIRAQSIRETLLEFDSEKVVAVLAAASLPDGEGLDLLKRIRAESPETITILLIDPGSTAPLNRAQEIGVDRTLVLAPDDVATVADLVRRAHDCRDIAEDRRRERALSGAFLASISTLTTTADPKSAIDMLPKRLVVSGAVSVAWTSRYDPGSDRFEPDVAAGIDRTSLRTIPANEIDIEAEGLVRIDAEDPQRITLLLRTDEQMFGGLHLYIDPPSLAGPERRLLASSGKALGLMLAGDEVRSQSDVAVTDAASHATVETRSTAAPRPESVPEPPDRQPVEIYSEVIAHELRNHIDVAQSYLRLGTDGDENEDMKRVDAALERIESVIEEAEAVAGHNVLDADKVLVDISTAAERVWNRIDCQDAMLDVTDLGTVRAHPGMLELLLENLFRNAVTHAGSDVTVRVGSLVEGIYVEDDGPGISPADRPSVFEWGFAGRSTKDGVGLAIVKRITEAHGWSVTISESEMGGARFEFDFDSKGSKRPPTRSEERY